jgi:23S rRNA pseudouridine1911/1915/1917 synthase
MSKLQIIYEDQTLLVLHKPCNLHSTSLATSSQASLAQLLLEYLPALAQVSQRNGEAGLINRLDFETSGLLVAAKNASTWQRLRAAIQAGEIRKSYLALLEGHLSQAFCVNAYIGSPNRRAAKVRVYSKCPAKKQRALPAESHFQPLAYSPELDASVCQVYAASARRHQIRAHAAHSGHCLLGDSLYGSRRALTSVSAALLLSECEAPSFILHAVKIAFTHPETGAALEFQSPLPDYLAQIFPELGHS